MNMFDVEPLFRRKRGWKGLLPKCLILEENTVFM